MKRFTFRLDRLLNLRRQVETDKARALAQARRREEAARQTSEEASAHLERCQEQLPGSAAEVSAAGTLHNLGLAVQTAAVEAAVADDNHRSAEDQVHVVQEAFGTARQERLMVEKLRDKRHEDWATDAKHEERKEYDGLSQQRWLSHRERGES